MPIVALIAAAAALGSAVVGYVAQRASDEQAARLMAQARDEFGNLDLPKLEELAAAEIPPTELAKIRTNPAFEQAQMKALNKLMEVQESGGLTLQDQAKQNQAMDKVARQEGAGREAIRENMAARGTLGSGAELAMSLANQQDSASRANLVGMTTAANAQDRAFDAIMQGGKLASSMRDQEFGEKSRVAEARDLINKYNASRYNGVAQQAFDNKLRKTAGMNGMTAGLAADTRAAGQRDARAIGAVGNAVSQGAAAVGTYGGKNQDTSQYALSPAPLVNADEEDEWGNPFPRRN